MEKKKEKKSIFQILRPYFKPKVAERDKKIVLRAAILLVISVSIFTIIDEVQYLFGYGQR